MRSGWYYDYVSYIDGRFEIDRDIEDGVDAEVSGSSIIFSIEIDALSSSYWDLSGDAYYFISEDRTPGYDSEIYSDNIPDFEGYEPFRSSSGDFDRDLDDNKGDVEYSYSDTTRTDDFPFMDIISLDVVMDSNDDYIFTLTLKDDVQSKGDLDYRFGTDDVDIWYSWDFEQISYDSTNEKTEGVFVKDNTISATIDGSKIDDLEDIYAWTSYEDYDRVSGESYSFRDSLNDIPIDEDYFERRFVENVHNLDMKMDLRFQGLDKAVLKISLEYYDGAYISDLKYALDRNMNGMVEADEIDEDEVLFIKNGIENKKFGMDLKVDNVSAEISTVYGLEGLLGDVNDESGILITAQVTYSFSISEKDIHSIDLRSYVKSNDDGSGYDEWDMDIRFNITDFGNLMDMIFVTPVGWRIQTASIHPDPMVEKVNDQRNMVRLYPYDFAKILNPEVELFGFDIKFEGGDGWDDLEFDTDDDDQDQIEDKKVKKDTPIPIWILFLSIMIVISFSILFDRRKK